ncbi:hypothetical protein [Rothia endophytica]|uniref:hypothetical protein n=1 Tax=Rothia endophytica TaxID=1324766 RepID=UPI001F1934F0|nr:hypothetical protein [Rothia endophytica]
MNTIGPPQNPTKKSEHSTKSPNPVAALALETTKLTAPEQSEKATSKKGSVINQNTSITDAKATFLRLHDIRDLVTPSGYTYIPDPVQPTEGVGHYSGAIEDGKDDYYFESMIDPINPLKDSAYHIEMYLEAASKKEVRAVITKLLNWWAERENEQLTMTQQAAK